MSSLPEKFPEEIWLAIFTDKGLEYKHLKMLTQVSKYFREIIKSSVFDRILFRTPLEKAGELTIGEKIALHPLMGRINFVCSDYDYAFVHISNECDWDSPTISSKEILDFPALKEFATSTTVKRLQIDLEFGILVVNNFGVTVKDVLDAIIKFWSQKDRKGHTRQDHLERNDHCVWSTWKHTKVQSMYGQPTIVATAGWYDS